MGLPVEIDPLLLSSAASSYQIGRSLRFRSSANAYLNRTPASASNRRTWTWSGWVKLGVLSSIRVIFGAGQNATTGIDFGFYSDNTFFYSINGVGTWNTTAVFRDPSAWYHVVFAFDSTQATQANRSIVYINNVNYSFTSNGVVLNNNYDVNNNIAQYFGQSGVSSQYLDGYLAEVNFIDGSALTSSSFGAYDANGVWQPAKYTGTYGTNGFYLPFSNTTSTTTLVQDSSGNGNNWTPNNISLTAGTTYDSMTDVPTNNSPTAANFATLNPLRTASSSTLSNANLSMSDTTNNHNYLSTIGITSGKWYFEAVASASGFTAAHAGIALSTISPDTYIGSDTKGYAYQATTGQVLYNNAALGTYSTWTAGDIIGVAFDADSGKLYVAKNNTWQNSGNPAGGTGAVATGIASGTWFLGIGCNPTGLMNVNFGQQPFSYTPPTGFVALNTYNLPTPTIKNGAQYMAATTYTGNGSTQSVSNGGNNTIGTTFKPDFVWIKSRSNILGNELFDSVRGVNQVLYSNATNAETNSGTMSAFNSNGFSAVYQASDISTNNSGYTYIGWQWLAGAGSSSSNTSGSITSTVSVNQTAGFSIVTYTGTGANATVGHGLGVAPSMIIVKVRNLGTEYWPVRHTSIAATNSIYLNATDAAGASTDWNNTAPTSTVFSIGTNARIGGAYNYVAYCFAAVSGYSAFGSYTGNGSTDGPFVFTGFRPRFILTKRTDTNDGGFANWQIQDTSRNTYNVADLTLAPSSSAAESQHTSTGYLTDILANGFKIRSTSGSYNASGGTFIYAAFAENPFNYSRAR